MASQGRDGADGAATGDGADAIIARHASQLGKVTDREFATVHGISVEDVERWRAEHGAPRKATVPRRVVAPVDPPPPRPARKPRAARAPSRGAAPEPLPPEPEPLPPEPLPPEPVPPRSGAEPRSSRLDPFRALVGVLSDREVAARAGVTRGLVHAYRKKHGIDSAGAPSRPSGEPTAPGAAAPSAAVAAPSPKGSGSRLEAFADRLGRVSDGAIAKEAGVSRAAVRAYRERRGIAPSVPRPARAGAGRSEGAVTKESRKKGRSKIEEVAHLVGKLTDGEVGAKVGVSAGAVRLYRVARGIAPAVPQGHHAPPAGPPAPAPAASPVVPSAAPPTRLPEPAGKRPSARKAGRKPAPPAPAAASAAPASAAPTAVSAAPASAASASAGPAGWAWRVVARAGGADLVRYVLATDAMAACRAAAALGDVLQAERVGQAL